MTEQERLGELLAWEGEARHYEASPELTAEAESLLRLAMAEHPEFGVGLAELLATQLRFVEATAILQALAAMDNIDERSRVHACKMLAILGNSGAGQAALN